LELLRLFAVPFSVESMLPEGALGIVSLVISLTVGAFEIVGARFALFRGRSRGVEFTVTLAAPS